MLHVERVEASTETPSKTFLFLHGILGSGTNLRTIAKRFVTQCPAWSAVLVDLRGHGKSPHGDDPQTLAACAHDLEVVAAQLAYPVRGVLGHSFGGKVAMAYAAQHRAELERLVVVDSMPGARRGGRGSESTLSVIEALKSVPAMHPNRDSFIDAMVRLGVERSTAMWLAMSLRREPEGFRIGFDLAQIDALLDDYFAVDQWPVLALGTDTNTQVIVGDRSPVFAEEDRARCLALQGDSKLEVVTLPAGHWVHVDDPDGLVKALVHPRTHVAKEPS
jgi:pimeloyl-ACP methyl ester carboxylesterase